MCGRYVSPDRAAIERSFNLSAKVERNPFAGDFNAVPTRSLPVLRENPESHELELDLLRWGLVPHWAKDLKFGSHTTNARAETVATKPSFRAAYKARRCLVPALGYYEWQAVPSGKQPYYFSAADGSMLSFAGLWESWRPPEGGDPVLTFTIIVGEANPFTRDVHDRMPIIVEPADRKRWLEDRDVDDLILPGRPNPLKRYPVSKAVNSSRSKGPALIEPTELASP